MINNQLRLSKYVLQCSNIKNNQFQSVIDRSLYLSMDLFDQEQTKQQMEFNKVQNILEKSVQYYNSYGIYDNLVDMRLCRALLITSKEKRRFNVTTSNITSQDLGLYISKCQDNLWGLVKNKKVTICNLVSVNQRKVILKLKTLIPCRIIIESGTLLSPQQVVADSTQTLILRDGVNVFLERGETELILESFCFNKELRTPGKERYLLSNVKSVLFKKEMHQANVWEVSEKMKQIAQQLMLNEQSKQNGPSEEVQGEKIGKK